MFTVMALCKQMPTLSVSIVLADTQELLYEGALKKCPYHICEAEIQKIEALFSHGIDYYIEVVD